jgi:hypothetical protein
MLGYIKAMKAKLAATVFSLAILFLAVAFIAGCKTTTVDWNSRVGNYSYNQALAELGSPAKQTKLSDGKTVDQWITLHGSTGFAGGANVGGLDTIGGNQPMMQTYKDHVLELTFDADGKLVSWAKNY